MRILMIGQKRYPNSREGGIDIVVQNLAEELVRHGHDVTLLVRKKRGYNPPKEYNGVKIKSIFTINNKMTDAIVYSWFATSYAKHNNFDVIHFHAEGNTLFLRRLRKSKDKKIIVTIHGLDWKRVKFKGIGEKILLKSEKAIVKYADKVITLCESDRDYFKNQYGLNTFLIPNGVSQPVFRDANIIKTKYSLNSDDYILFLARIVPEKGLHFLIDAFMKLESPKKKLVIAGGSSHSSKYYEEMIRKASANQNVIFTGFVNGDELCELFSNAYLYVLPSTIEGMPLSLIEALSYKRICLCSNIRELMDIDSKNITYFDSENIDDLANKLEQIIEEKPACKQERLFLTWKEVAEKTIQVYEKND